MKSMRKSVLMLFGILIISQMTYSQKKWTLEECILYARENNLQIRQSAVTAEVNRENLTQSKLSVLPTVNAGASQNYSWGRNVDPTSNSFTDQQTRSNSFALNSSMSLFNGFQKVNSVRQSQMDYKASQMDLERSKNDIALAVAQYYLQILFNRELLAAAERQSDIIKLQVERTRKLVDAGTLPKGSLYEIQAQEASEEANVIAAQNQLELSYLDLAQLLDLKSTVGFEIVIPDLKLEENPILPDPITVYAKALETQPDIKSAEFRLKSNSIGVSIARGMRLPSLSMSFYYGTNYIADYKDYSKLKSGPTLISETPTSYYVQGTNQVIMQKNYATEFETLSFKDQLDRNLSKSLTFNLNIPIFNGYQASSSVKRAKLNALNAEYSLETNKNQLRKKIEQAYADAQGAMKSYVAAQKSTLAFKESFTYTEQKFLVGVTNSIEYNTAKNNLFKAESESLKSKYNFIFKKMILDFYAGNTLVIK